MKKITALIADDMLQMRLLLKTLLRQLDCDVHMVEDGSKVIKAIQDHQPDILFLDLDMPVMSGLDVLSMFDRLKHPPYTVVITADTTPKSRSLALDYGANAFITKPYSEQMISDVLKSYSALRDAPVICTTLIAEDDDLMRNLLRSMLEKQHCRIVHSVRNGAEALDCLERGPEPDLVFLDIEMPVLDGLSALRKIREKGQDVFCAMVSAHSSFDNVKSAMNQGADGFIVKPYTEEKLRQVLGKYQGRRKNKAEAS